MFDSNVCRLWEEEYTLIHRLIYVLNTFPTPPSICSSLWTLLRVFFFLALEELIHVWENNPDGDVILVFVDNTLMTESLHYKLGEFNMKDCQGGSKTLRCGLYCGSTDLELKNQDIWIVAIRKKSVISLEMGMSGKYISPQMQWRFDWRLLYPLRQNHQKIPSQCVFF